MKTITIGLPRNLMYYSCNFMQSTSRLIQQVLVYQCPSLHVSLILYYRTGQFSLRWAPLRDGCHIWHYHLQLVVALVLTLDNMADFYQKRGSKVTRPQDTLTCPPPGQTSGPGDPLGYTSDCLLLQQQNIGLLTDVR